MQANTLTILYHYPYHAYTKFIPGCSVFFAAIYLPFGASQAPVKHPPLITTCQVMQQVIMDVQTALNATGSGISCRLSTNCTQVQCRRPTHGYPIFMLEIQACNDPVTLKIVRFNDTRGRIAHESVIEMSSMIGVDLGYGFVILNFTLAQRRTRLSLGLKVCISTSSPLFGTLRWTMHNIV